MAMRRRFFRRAFPRRFGRPVRREKPVWATTNFNETAVTRDGALNEFAIIDPELLGTAAVTTNVTQVISTRRIIVRGGVAWSNESTTFAQDIITAFMAVYVIDREDTDATIVGTAVGSSILEGGAGRVLWTDCQTLTNVEIPVGTPGTQQYFGMRIDIDLKVRTNLRNDQLLLFGFQFGSDVTATMAAAALSCVSRVLVVNER